MRTLYFLCSLVTIDVENKCFRDATIDELKKAFPTIFNNPDAEVEMYGVVEEGIYIDNIIYKAVYTNNDYIDELKKLGFIRWDIQTKEAIDDIDSEHVMLTL